MTASSHSAQRTQGFTLLEVLIALLVLSIGLLGISKLVMLSAKANDSAYMRSQATALAFTILDAMRANRAVALSGPPYAYDVAIGANPGAVACPAPPAGCPPASQAQNDIANWKAALGAALPGGDGNVQISVATDPVTTVSNVTVAVTVQWNDTVAQKAIAGPAANAIATVSLESIL